VFDEVDKKYGIPEEERQSMDTSSPVEGDEMGGAPPPPAGDIGGEEPLSEGTGKSNKSKILSMLGDESQDFDDLFDVNKAQQNIYEVENKLKDILND
jgi:hypothetical protein